MYLDGLYLTECHASVAEIAFSGAQEIEFRCTAVAHSPAWSIARSLCCLETLTSAGITLGHCASRAAITLDANYCLLAWHELN
jgi:hypothetical protein